MGIAAHFIDALRKLPQPLAAFIDDPDGFGAALDGDPAILGRAFADAAGDMAGPPVTLTGDGFASAACDRYGSVTVAAPRFLDWFDGTDPFIAAVRDIHPDRPHVSLLADDRNGRPVALAAGTQAVARNWPLDPLVRTAIERGGYALVAFRPGALSWARAQNAYRLTPAEIRLVEALAGHGDLQRAAQACGVAYETARKFVASAMRKTGSVKQTELIRATLSVAAGEMPDTRGLGRLARDLFGLTARQADLAILIARGASRDEAAAALGISSHRAKADLKSVFQACGVASAVDLSRIFSEINALQGLANACEVTIAGPAGDEPLRLVPRRWAAGRIAVADHGPSGGKPVFVFHSTMTGRHHSRRFVTTLRNAGYRPIMIERPGFGLTDTVDGDPVTAAVNDIADVRAAFGLGAIPVIARCTVASVIATLAHALGDVSGGVMIWPDAPPRDDPNRKRMSDRGRALFARHPALARGFCELLSRRSGSAIIERLWRSGAAGISSDLTILDTPQDLADIIRATRQAALGMTGFMNEALSVSAGPQPVSVPDPGNWTILLGTGFERYDVTDARAFWCAALPGATVDIVDDGVHFLHLTHIDHVIAALDRMNADDDYSLRNASIGDRREARMAG